MMQDDVWPMYSQYSNTSAYPQFWDHEYSKHLVCAIGQVPRIHSVESAFATVVALHANMSIRSTLASAGIQPSTQPLRLEAILQAVQSVAGVMAQARCNGPSMQWLSTVLLCYDTNLHLIDCPTIPQKTDTPPPFAPGDVPCDASQPVYLMPAVRA